MWFRLYENAYPQPLILGDRQLIDDQRFMLRTQNNDRHLEIVGARKDDQGYYICKTGNTIRSSYNLTITSIKYHLMILFLSFSFFFTLANTCIDIIPNNLHVNINDVIRLVCRIRSTDAFNEQNLRVQWTRNVYQLINIAECLSNYSSIDGTLYETLIIRKARRPDSGIYTCRYGDLLTATAHVVVSQCMYLFYVFFLKIFFFFFYLFLDPGGSKSRRLISQMTGNSSSSKASLRTVVSFFYIVYQIVFVFFS
jgi:hypothetical protein